MAIGYATPEEGQADLGGNYMRWLRLRDRTGWFSPKDVSGLERSKGTPGHIRALEGQIIERRKLPRARKDKRSRLHP